MDVVEVYAVCEADQIRPGWVYPFFLERLNANGLGEPFPILIARDEADNFFAYANVCPHQNLPVYGAPEECLGVDDLVLVCRRHGAKFAIGTGVCVKGACEGAAMEQFPVAVIDGEVCIAGVSLVEEGADGPPEVMITAD